MKDRFIRGVKKVRKKTKSDLNPVGVNVMADMDGVVKMTSLTNKVDKEIFAEVSINQTKLTSDWKNLLIKEKCDIL